MAVVAEHPLWALLQIPQTCRHCEPLITSPSVELHASSMPTDPTDRAGQHHRLPLQSPDFILWSSKGKLSPPPSPLSQAG